MEYLLNSLCSIQRRKGGDFHQLYGTSYLFVKKTLTGQLFNEVRNNNTSIMVERIVNDIDQIVRIVRFPGWQQTIAGDREVKQALRRTLLKYKLHQEQDLFDRAYEYIKQYY